ncbi:cyclase [Pandoraea terrae]|uniref:Cyclase n=1 Tax=Pandoraea terrae TaxID=1537710 RepID=A0A5E4SBV4_9BURK|nr:cyclase family protein [Pandoraea terrae]VVD71499.1 cyclase [Pandoraea terrae]
MLKALAQALQSGAVRVIDLSQTLHGRTPIIPLPPQYGQSAPFRIEEISNFDDRGPAWYWNNISCGEHTGTHFDAPIHWITGKDFPDNTTETIDVQKLIAPACVIDVSAETRENPDYLLTIERVEQWESEHGRIPAGSWVLMRTDWSLRTDPDAFLNLKEDGAHTPGGHPDLPAFLARERNVIGWGAEGVGTDAGQAYAFSQPFPCHANMHGNNKFGLASLVNLDKLPATGALLITPPLKIRRGSGSPCRVLALVEV